MLKGAVLIAEDEEGLREFLVEALEDVGHEVAQASDGQEALERLQQESFQVLITDLKMPRLDGMSLIRKVRVEQPELEIIVMTAHGTVDNAVEAMKLGAFDFIQKPLPGPSALRLLVERALERHRLKASVEVTKHRGPQLAFAAPQMKQIEAVLKKVATTDATVLLTGESGTGKEVAALGVHAWSPRRDGPFVAVNCAALSESLLESELFGHEKGAFTSADHRRRGRIELAEGGTFFLDEVGELKPALQAKLLRVLQEKTFERVGGHQTIRANVRWLAATNRVLEEEVDAGRFREDLYHRLSVFPVRLPNLAERAEDIVPLAELLTKRLGAEMGRPGLSLDEAAKQALSSRAYRGNIRELANVLERAAILADSDEIQPHDIDRLMDAPRKEAKFEAAPVTMEQAERVTIERALAACNGNRKAAASRLGIGLRTLYDKIKKYDLP